MLQEPEHALCLVHILHQNIFWYYAAEYDVEELWNPQKNTSDQSLVWVYSADLTNNVGPETK